MKLKALVVLSIFLLSSITSTYSYDRLECSSDAVFSEYSCNECFKGGTVSKGADPISFLSDKWINQSSSDKILYKEVQEMPKMVNLDETNVSWSQTPDSDNFWKYTDAFNALYSEVDSGYILKAGQSVDWIESELGYGYKLDKDNAQNGDNIGLLVYTLNANNIGQDGTPEFDYTTHKECVLFTSGEPVKEEVKQERKELPATGPAQYILLLAFAMILGLGIFKFRKQS